MEAPAQLIVENALFSRTQPSPLRMVATPTFRCRAWRAAKLTNGPSSGTHGPRPHLPDGRDQCKASPSRFQYCRNGTNAIAQVANRIQPILVRRESRSARQRARRSADSVSVKPTDNEPPRGSQFNTTG